MKISVVIPTYNSAKTIQTTLASVLCQTVSPCEILVLDDGSTDNTVAVLNLYTPQVTVIQQENKGVAAARNILAAHAKGDLIAFLDHDDIWHPIYLEVQGKLYAKYPRAVAFFAGHVNFFGYGKYEWQQSQFDLEKCTHVIDRLEFFKMYNTHPGLFGSASFFCVPKPVLTNIGHKPFPETVSGADDSYLCNLLPLLGPVVYAEIPLVAYRIIKEAQSTNQIKAFELGVEVFQLLEHHYRKLPTPNLRREFWKAFASRRRQYAKRLLSAARTSDARMQLWYSLRQSFVPSSIAKSLALLCATYLPARLQPKWPPNHRAWNTSAYVSADGQPSVARLNSD